MAVLLSSDEQGTSCPPPTRLGALPYQGRWQTRQLSGRDWVAPIQTDRGPDHPSPFEVDPYLLPSPLYRPFLT